MEAHCIRAANWSRDIGNGLQRRYRTIDYESGNRAYMLKQILDIAR